LEFDRVELVKPHGGPIGFAALDHIPVAKAWRMQHVQKSSYVTHRGWTLIELPTIVPFGVTEELHHPDELILDKRFHPGPPNVPPFSCGRISKRRGDRSRKPSRGKSPRARGTTVQVTTTCGRLLQRLVGQPSSSTWTVARWDGSAVDSAAVTAHAELRTERLLLRPFLVDDVADALAYRDDVEFARFLSHIPQPFTIRDAEAFVALNMAEPWETSPTFAVVLHGRVIGTANLEVDAEKSTAMLGYAIGRAWWGQGIATEAARAAIVWGIEAFALARIWASTDVRHLRSRRVLEKLGMKPEALRVGDHVGRFGEPVDEVVYGLSVTR
jgi:[ribosomal protein S5]-alanine N-acetyltransferase